MGQHYITKDGLEKLKIELDDLKANKMPTVIERIARARELGDLAENAEYQDAKDEQAFIAGRIAELEHLINKSELITESHGGDTVLIGSTVRVRCEGKEFEYRIVGSNEADPAKGLISNESPIARAFIGKKPGEQTDVHAPRGSMRCEILEIK